MDETKRKKNCWEFQRCGREPRGKKVNTLGICPAAIETNLDEVHGGKNAGRACWIVAGTFCEGEVQGIYARKHGMPVFQESARRRGWLLSPERTLPAKNNV